MDLNAVWTDRNAVYIELNPSQRKLQVAASSLELI